MRTFPRYLVGLAVPYGEPFLRHEPDYGKVIRQRYARGSVRKVDPTKSLIPLLVEHDWDYPIGKVTRIDDTAASPWDGTWEMAVVSLERRSAADRLALRKAATALHLAELREGIWFRPDNLDQHRLPTLRAVLDRQCVHFQHVRDILT